jgi:hypothetical protein
MEQTPLQRTSEQPDLLEHLQEQKKRRRRRRRSKLGHFWRFIVKDIRWRLIFITLTVISVVAIGTQVVLVTDAMNQVEDSYNNINRIVNTITGKSGTDLTLTDFDRLEVGINDLQNSISTMQSRLRFVRGFASINPDWEVMLQALDASEQLTLGVRSMLNGLEPVLFYTVDGQEDEAVTTQISSGERIVELLTIGTGQFSSAQSQFDQVRQTLDNMDLNSVSPSVLLQIREIEALHQQAEEINAILLQAPDILTLALGMDETQNYLILSQNSDELRPSGGYISTYGWISVRNGRIIDYEYYPTTRETPLPPPEEFGSAFAVPEWWIQYRDPIFAMWDGSWYANFQRTAEMASMYYNLNENNPKVPIQGVIGIDIYAFENILEALRSVSVIRLVDDEEQIITITPDNFRELVYDIRAFGEANEHKEFIADVYEEIFTEWQDFSGDPETSEQLLGVLLESLLEKHIMLYSPNPQAQLAINILDWGGSQEAAFDHDYIMVADANLGNKSNRSILRQLTYDAAINLDGTVNSRIAISYEYPDEVASDDPAVDPEFHGPIDYNNLLQVYVTANSQYVDSENLGLTPTQIDESTHTIFAARSRIEYDTAQRYQIMYDTPVVVDTVGPYQRYRLLIQKQPGVEAENVSVQIRLPEGASFVSSDPTPAATYFLESLILDYRLNIRSDQWIEVLYEQP